MASLPNADFVTVLERLLKKLMCELWIESGISRLPYSLMCVR